MPGDPFGEGNVFGYSGGKFILGAMPKWSTGKPLSGYGTSSSKRTFFGGTWNAEPPGETLRGSLKNVRPWKEPGFFMSLSCLMSFSSPWRPCWWFSFLLFWSCRNPLWWPGEGLSRKRRSFMASCANDCWSSRVRWSCMPNTLRRAPSYTSDKL